MALAEFSVDAASVLKQCEVELESQGPAAIGLRFGCREIRRHLAAIGRRAIELGDEELTRHLVALCVLRPIPDGCLCPKACDCQKYPTHQSEHCPVHMENPKLYPECPAHGC